MATRRIVGTIPWYRRASVWLGIGINPASISVGGGLATRLPLRDLLWLIPVGACLLTLLSLTQGLIGRRRGQRLNQIAGATFGVPWGASLLNLLMALGMIGWGGFHGGVSGASAAHLFHLPGWLGALLVVLALFVLTELGVNRWSAVLWLTTGAALALTLFALSKVDLHMSTVQATGAPPPEILSLGEWLWALGTLIAYATLFSLRNPDFTWDLTSDSDVIKANLCLLFPLIFSMGVGALLYRTTGHWNIADILTATRSATLGHIFLLIAVASPLLSGLYSGALALASLTRFHLRTSTALICGLIFVLAAVRFDKQLLPFLGLIGAALGPALAVVLLINLLPSKIAPPFALSGWLIGALVALLCQVQGQSFATPLGVAVSLAVVRTFLVIRPALQGKEREKKIVRLRD